MTKPDPTTSNPITQTYLDDIDEDIEKIASQIRVRQMQEHRDGQHDDSTNGITPGCYMCETEKLWPNQPDDNTNETNTNNRPIPETISMNPIEDTPTDEINIEADRMDDPGTTNLNETGGDIPLMDGDQYYSTTYRTWMDVEFALYGEKRKNHWAWPTQYRHAEGVNPDLVYNDRDDNTIQGVKDDDGKTKFSLLPHKALLTIESYVTPPYIVQGSHAECYSLIHKFHHMHSYCVLTECFLQIASLMQEKRLHIHYLESAFVAISPILDELGQVSTYGALKYSPGNWRFVEWDRYLDAAERHLLADEKGELINESGIPNLAHAAVSILMAIENHQNQNENGTD